MVPPESVLVAITGQGKTRGTAALLCFQSTINQHLAYITPRGTSACALYLHLVMQGAYQELRAISDDQGGTKGALTCADLKHFKVPLPPLEEQAVIANAVGLRTTRITMVLATLTKELALLHEYRTRLIADVVTGQLDVREAATRLPDEPNEDTAPDDELPPVEDPAEDGLDTPEDDP